jgi:hypothetical protein
MSSHDILRAIYTARCISGHFKAAAKDRLGERLARRYVYRHAHRLAHRSSGSVLRRFGL